MIYDNVDVDANIIFGALIDDKITNGEVSTYSHQHLAVRRIWHTTNPSPRRSNLLPRAPSSRRVLTVLIFSFTCCSPQVSITVLATGFATDFFSTSSITSTAVDAASTDSSTSNSDATTSTSTAVADRDGSSSSAARGGAQRTGKFTPRGNAMPTTTTNWRADAVAARERLPGARNMGKTAPTSGNTNSNTNKFINAAESTAESGEDFASYRNRMVNNNANSGNNRFKSSAAVESKPMGVFGRIGRWIKRIFS